MLQDRLKFCIYFAEVLDCTMTLIRHLFLLFSPQDMRFFEQHIIHAPTLILLSSLQKV